MSFIDKLVRSKAYKNFMAKLYGWGASVVIIGALFKINHWPGAVPMLIIGMGTESIIFFLSAFEPLHVEWDWSLVYPELAGMKETIEGEEQVDQLAGGQVSQPLTQQLDKMLEDAKIGPELIDRLGQGMQNLADSATSLNNMSTAVAATDKFVSGMDSAASAADELTQAYKRTTESMNSDINLSAGYSESLRDATAAVSTLSNIYKETAQTLQKGDASYLDELKKMATSLSSINAMYEIQIQNSTSQLEATKEVQDRIQSMVANFADSADGMMKYKEQVDALTRKVAELNNVYGNMLAAMHARV
ncbi:MAG: gliding motility protein GldL [Bacteroidales bacterium]|nr:gliding motility protein GldL [Bacteroidales bacterium]